MIKQIRATIFALSLSVGVIGNAGEPLRDFTKLLSYLSHNYKNKDYNTSKVFFAPQCLCSGLSVKELQAILFAINNNEQQNTSSIVWFDAAHKAEVDQSIRISLKAHQVVIACDNSKLKYVDGYLQYHYKNLKKKSDFYPARSIFGTLRPDLNNRFVFSSIGTASKAFDDKGQIFIDLKLEDFWKKFGVFKGKHLRYVALKLAILLHGQLKTSRYKQSELINIMAFLIPLICETKISYYMKGVMKLIDENGNATGKTVAYADLPITHSQLLKESKALVPYMHKYYNELYKRHVKKCTTQAKGFYDCVVLTIQ